MEPSRRFQAWNVETGYMGYHASSLIQKKYEKKKGVVLMLEKGSLKGKASFLRFPLVPFPDHIR